MLVSAPDDYGLTPDATLAHRDRTPPPPRVEATARELAEEIDALPAAWRGTVDGARSPVRVPSIRDVLVAAEVHLPEDAPRGIVVTSHGADDADGFDEAPPPWCAQGLAAVRVRVRGYPPSTDGVGDRREDWIVHHLGRDDAWIVRGAIADLATTARCARRALGADLPLFLHGESLGGGLAVLATAMLERLGAPPKRLAIGLPSLGAWAWRDGRRCTGTGALVNEALCAARDDADDVLDSMRRFDAVLHAARVFCPVLAKLAERDDVVPAPSAAAVVNALASDEVGVFPTRFGHYDGGLADARRHVRFERLAARFLDPDRDPAETLAEAEVLPRPAP